MSELEEKLGAILGNPQMMQQILSMAQAMNASAPAQEEPPKTPPQPSAAVPDLDPAMLRKLAAAAGSGVDQHQKALLSALQPYVSRSRVSKLERAMRAARLAGAATSFLNSGALQMLSGR